MSRLLEFDAPHRTRKAARYGRKPTFFERNGSRLSSCYKSPFIRSRVWDPRRGQFSAVTRPCLDRNANVKELGRKVIGLPPPACPEKNLFVYFAYSHPHGLVCPLHTPSCPPVGGAGGALGGSGAGGARRMRAGERLCQSGAQQWGMGAPGRLRLAQGVALSLARPSERTGQGRGSGASAQPSWSPIGAPAPIGLEESLFPR